MNNDNNLKSFDVEELAAGLNNAIAGYNELLETIKQVSIIYEQLATEANTDDNNITSQVTEYSTLASNIYAKCEEIKTMFLSWIERYKNAILINDNELDKILNEISTKLDTYNQTLNSLGIKEV